MTVTVMRWAAALALLPVAWVVGYGLEWARWAGRDDWDRVLAAAYPRARDKQARGAA